MTLLARRYAKALFQAAGAAEAIDAVDADLSRLSGLLRNPEVAGPLLSPDTPTAVRQRAFPMILGDAHTLTQNLVGVVLRRRREAVLVDLSAAFKELVRQSRGKALGLLETAKSIDEAGLQALEQRATALTGKNVTLEVKIDPDLIGGVRIRVGNTLYDGSVATALEDLAQRLVDAPI